MNRLLYGVLGCLIATMAVAAGPTSVRERVEDSMVVTGTIAVTPQGTVLAYALDHPEKLPSAVAQAVSETLPRWTFQPVLRDGKPVASKSRMSLRVVAHPIGGGNYRVMVNAAYFGDPGAAIKRTNAVRIAYPRPAIRERLAATVYMLLRIDRTGKVVDATAEQVNLQAIADDRTLDRYRQLFADASVKGLRQWIYSPADPSDPAPYRILQMPVVYSMDPRAETPYGQWQAYVPGPLQPVPWLDDKTLLASGVDALPGDGLYGPPSLSLMTPLNSG